jgi:hypothetical protein
MRLIAGNHRVLNEILVPLSSFSRAMKVRSGVLCDLIPSVQEVFQQWRILAEKHGGSPLAHTLFDAVTAHFSLGYDKTPLM